MENINEVLETLSLNKVSEVEAGRSVIKKLLRNYARPLYKRNEKGKLEPKFRYIDFKSAFYVLPTYFTNLIVDKITEKLIEENLSGYDFEYLKTYIAELIKTELMFSIYKYGELEKVKEIKTINDVDSVTGVVEINEILNNIDLVTTMLGIKLNYMLLISIIEEVRKLIIDDIKDFIYRTTNVRPMTIFGYLDMEKLEMFISYSLVSYDYIPTDFLVFIVTE